MRIEIDGVGEMVNKTKNILVVGCVGTIGGGAVGLYRLNQLYDTHEIILMGATVMTVSICGRFALVKLREAVRGSETPISDFVNMVRSIFVNSPQIADQPEGWVDRMAAKYRPGSSSYALPVGVNENGVIQEVRMLGAESHMMVQGVTGTGKTVLINQIICGAGLSGNYQVVLVGDSLTDHVEVEKMKNVYTVEVGEDLPIGNDSGLSHSYPLELRNVLSDTVREMKRRKDLMRKKKVKKIGQIRKRDRPQSILLIIDEFQNAVMAADAADRSLSRTIQGLAAQVAREGRKFNVHLLLVAQRATKDLSAGLRSQLVMITYKTKDANESRYATGSSSADAHTLDEGDIERGLRPGIIVSDQKMNRRMWVEITHDVDFERLVSMDQTEVGEEPLWLNGYRSTGRTSERPILPDNSPVILRTRNEVETVPIPVVPEVGERKITNATGTGTPSTNIQEVVFNVRNWAGKLFDTHEDYMSPPSRLTREKVINIALCGLIGLSENATMRAVFNGNKKPEYREDVKNVFLHMVEAGLDVA